MKKTCFKCGIIEGELQQQSRGVYRPATVITHHTQYIPELIVNCCLSCHKTIHCRVKRNKTCKYTVEKVRRLSRKSVQRRTIKEIKFNESITPNVRLCETVRLNTSTNSIHFLSFFKADNHKSLLEIFL